MVLEVQAEFDMGTGLEVRQTSNPGEARVLRAFETERMTIQFKSMNATERSRLQEFARVKRPLSPPRLHKRYAVSYPFSSFVVAL